MGALREAVRDPVAERLKKSRRAGAAGRAADVVVETITPKIDPALSKQIETALKYMRAKRLAAHKGEIKRTKSLTKDELRTVGLGHIADLEDALGIKKF